MKTESEAQTKQTQREQSYKEQEWKTVGRRMGSGGDALFTLAIDTVCKQPRFHRQQSIIFMSGRGLFAVLTPIAESQVGECT